MNKKQQFNKIGVVGTGAVGGFFGAKLALAGSSVVFLSRGKNLEKMKKDGLTLDSLGEVTVIKNVIFTDDASQLNDCDLILFTVKSYDTLNTIEQIKDHVKENAIILTPQNSISNDKLLAQEFGNDRVIPGFAKVGVGMPKPAYVKHTSLGIINFGEYDGSVSERIKALEKLFLDADVEAVVHENIQVSRWKKFIWNSTFNIIAAIVEQPLDVILDHKPSYDLCVKTIKEIEQIAIKEGIDFGNEDVVEARMALSKKLGHFKPSTLEDVEKGKPIELEAFTGTVIELAEKYDLNVPINKTLYSLLSCKVKK
ncbi:MAG: ketopantoate reductase family protein [Candidatus Woesebacteria bacterium]|jgi:2-dehydropantoate 2-reductase